MNGPLERLRRLISGPDQALPICAAALDRYNECVAEWNDNWTDDEWCDGPRGQSCADYIFWFEETHR